MDELDELSALWRGDGRFLADIQALSFELKVGPRLLPVCELHKWYVDRHAAPVMFGLGVYGQYLFVAVEQGGRHCQVSCQPSPLDNAQIALMGRAAAATRQWLAS